MIVLQRPSLEYGIWQMEGPEYLTYLFKILRLQNVSAALDVKDHLVEPDLGRVRVPQVLVVVDELGADGEPQLDDVGLPMEVDEAGEGDCGEEE